MKRVPSFWWDFQGTDEIIVESDLPDFPIIKRFKYNPKGGVRLYGEEAKSCRQLGFSTDHCGCAIPAIEQAEKLIDDLKAGRVNLKDILKG